MAAPRHQPPQRDRRRPRADRRHRLLLFFFLDHNELTLSVPARHHGFAHVKLSASSVDPDPLYFATSGYAHSGRVRTTFPPTTRLAFTASGAVPFSTQVESVASVSNWSVPTPSPQC